MKSIVYRPDGCVDFAATKAVREGTALTPEELKELEALLANTEEDEESFYHKRMASFEDPSKAKAEEFWSDTCWTEPHFSNPI
jgi:hypothetical protein